jgi:hypothetical protein
MMSQTAGTYVVDDGALMSGEQCIRIYNCKVTVEPIEDAKAPRKRKYFESVADVVGKIFVVAIAIYMTAEVIYAFTSGAVERLVH